MESSSVVSATEEFVLKTTTVDIRVTFRPTCFVRMEVGPGTTMVVFSSVVNVEVVHFVVVLVLPEED